MVNLIDAYTKIETIKKIKTYLKNIFPEFNDIVFSSHVLRYTFIVNAYKKGVDLAVISKLTGHRNIEMLSQCYLTFDDQFLNSQFEIINKNSEINFYNDLINELNQIKIKNKKLMYALNLAYELITFFKPWQAIIY